MVLIYIFPQHRAVAAGLPVQPLSACACSASIGLTAERAASRARAASATAGLRRRAGRRPASSASSQADGAVQAWAFLDADHALGQARALRRRPPRRAAAPGRCTACRSASRTSSTRPTCRPRTAPSLMPAARRGATPPCVARAARRRRGDPGQDRDHRVRLPTPRQDAQPARPRRARPAVRPRGSAAAVAAGMVPLAHRHADQRLGHPPGRVLRRGTASSRRTG